MVMVLAFSMTLTAFAAPAEVTGEFKLTKVWQDETGKVLEEVEAKLGIGDGECTPDGKFSLEVCRCVGACGLAPVMIVAGDVYGKMTPDRVGGILAKYE